jgi:hypothetical protein
VNQTNKADKKFGPLKKNIKLQTERYYYFKIFNQQQSETILKNKYCN